MEENGDHGLGMKMEPLIRGPVIGSRVDSKRLACFWQPASWFGALYLLRTRTHTCRALHNKYVDDAGEKEAGDDTGCLDSAWCYGTSRRAHRVSMPRLRKEAVLDF